MSDSEVLARVAGWLQERNFLVSIVNGKLHVEVKRNEKNKNIPVPTILGEVSKDNENTLVLGFQYNMDEETHRAFIYLNQDDKIQFIQRVEGMFERFGVAANFIPNAGEMRSLQILNMIQSDTLEKNSFLQMVLDLYAVFTNVIISILELNKTGKYFPPSKLT